MKKIVKEIFVCSECGNEFSRWAGQCSACGAWNSLKAVQSIKTKGVSRAQLQPAHEVQLLKFQPAQDVHERIRSGIGELDRVLGGEAGKQGFVSGGVVLLAGEPGIGKSTLLSQLCLSLARELDVLYVSGEESVTQVEGRMIRLKAPSIEINDTKISVLSDNDVENIISIIEKHAPRVVVIDSIQTMISSTSEGSSGSISQVRDSSARLIQCAKRLGVVMILVGHVTKEGSIAGPRLLEHVVDVVLWFEGDRQSDLRMLRGVKNRYGSTHEIGLFVMREKGLISVENPSEIFLADRQLGVPGSVVTAIMEGTRVLLVEVQALVVSTNLPMPRRVASGIEYNRLQTLLAVLVGRMGVRLENSDVYINVVGGLRVDDPAVDAAVCVAILSAVKHVALAKDDVVIGEVGLLGEMRSVRYLERRVEESLRLGYSRIVGPVVRETVKGYTGMNRLTEISKLLGVGK